MAQKGFKRKLTAILSADLERMKQLGIIIGGETVHPAT